MSEIFSKEIKQLINLVTTGFDDFYKSADNKSSGYYSHSVSSGYKSHSASSGDFSRSASSGNYSRSVSSGDYSRSVSSGDFSTSVSSGDSSTSASSGNYSRSASSGDSSTSASSGNYSRSASSGDFSRSASSGDFSRSASSGLHAACSALGYRAVVKGDLGNLLMCSEYNQKGEPLGGKADVVDGKILKPGCWYIVEKNEWVEVDLTDNIFSYVISTRGNVKKCRTEDDKIIFIVSDGEHSAHGKTVKEAKQDLIFKTQSRDVSEYKNLDLRTKKTPMEWAVVYRDITGACLAGIKIYMENKKLKKFYTLEEIIKETEGAFEHDKFKKFFKGDEE